jgi:uncharacterized protein
MSVQKIVVTWNETKRRENLDKHKVDLALAAQFDFQAALVEDDRDVRPEQRFRAIGPIGSTLYFLVFTLGENDEPHAISLRRAEPKERRRYVENL